MTTKTDIEFLKSNKARIKRQNEKIKENYDRVTAILPKGTVARIKALGFTVNGVINDSVLSFLERAEERLKTREDLEDSRHDTECQESPRENDPDQCIQPDVDKKITLAEEDKIRQISEIQVFVNSKKSTDVL